MTVRVTIECGNTTITVAGDSGFDDSIRVARVLRKAIDSLEGTLPRNGGLLLGDMLVLELGGRLPGLAEAPRVTQRITIELAPIPEEPLAVLPAREPVCSEKVRDRIAKIGLLLKERGPMGPQEITNILGLSIQQVRDALELGAFPRPRFGTYACHPQTDAPEEKSA